MNMTRNKIISLILGISIITIPLIVIKAIPSDSTAQYNCKVAITEDFGSSLKGKLKYYLVRNIEGDSPSEFVATLDSSYTRGLSRITLNTGEEVWMQGNIMTQDVFYGEQYLFFNYPQIYVSQIKDEGLWPNQKTELRIMYTAPIRNISSVVSVWIFPFIEEFSPDTFTVLIAQATVVIATIVLLVKRWKNKQHITLIILSYALVMILLTIPLLTNLY